MVIEAKKINFHFENDMRHCVHDVISVWLSELDSTTNERTKLLLKTKIIELEQLINRTGKPNIHFKDGDDYDKIIIS